MWNTYLEFLAKAVQGETRRGKNVAIFMIYPWLQCSVGTRISYNDEGLVGLVQSLATHFRDTLHYPKFCDL